MHKTLLFSTKTHRYTFKSYTLANFAVVSDVRIRLLKGSISRIRLFEGPMIGGALNNSAVDGWWLIANNVNCEFI
jgi:hypothetical protein